MANLRHAQAVGEGRLHIDLHGFFRGQSCGEAGRSFRFHADDPDTRLKRLQSESYSGDKAGPTYRHDHGIDVRDLSRDLQANRALTRDNRRIIIAIDISEITLRGYFVSMFACFA